MISLDLTLVYQIIGFFVLLIVLNTFLYRPVQRVLKERDEKIDGTLKKAAQTEKDVVDGLADYDKKIKEAAVKGHEERNRIRQEGLEREKEVLEAARAKASSELAKMRNELASDKNKALGSLKEESKQLSKTIAERILERSVLSILLTIGISLVPALALATEEAHGGGSGSTWKIINFVILAVGVYLVWTKVIAKQLDGRGAEIKKALDEAQSAKDAADRKAAEYREKLNLLDKRIAEIHNELKLEGEAEKQRIIADSEAAAKKVAEQAKAAAEQELKKARIEIREEVARLSTQLAEEIIKKELKPEDQEKLVRGYLNNLRLN